MPSGEVGGAAVPSRVQLGGIRIAPVTGGGPAVDPLDRPMSFAQQRLWFLDQLGAMGDAYRISRWMELEGELDVAAFRRAIEGVVERQQAFRTTFLSVDGTPVQRIHPTTPGRFPVREHDLREHADARGELERLMAEAGAEGFDLATGPLIRGRIFLLPGGRSRFLLNAHHIICDGWSMGIFDHEVGVLYGAFSRGEPDPLPPLAMQYGDYAGWQRDPSRAGSLQAQAEFWRETLSGAPELLELPTDHPRPAQQDKTGAFSPFHLGEDLSAGLKALSRRHGVTLFTTLFAAWAVVLARVTGQDDLVIGTPTANRRKREILRLVGFFVNTLAIRVDLGGAESVGELLARVKAQSGAAQRNQEIPFEQVVDAVAPARSMAYHPLIQVMFTFQNAFRETLEMPGMTVADAGWTVAVTAMFDLTLTLQEEGERLIGSLGYATALFEPATIERYIGYLRNVLEAMAADDAQAPAALAMLPAAERTQVVEGWNATAAEYPADACVHELFEAQAARTPDAVAVSSEAGSLTYAELNAAANRLAHHLSGCGVGPDVRVGLCVERSPEMMAGLLAVLKAGGTYVPLDPAYPADRLRFMLEDSAPAVLLADGAQAARFAGWDVPVVDLVADASAWADESAENPARGALTPEHLAYVIYTSGSTGRPKGVMNEHRCLVNRLTWGQRAWRLEAGEAVLAKTSLSFDGHVRELLWPLMAGGRVVLARPDGHRDPEYLVTTICDGGITTVNLVPSQLQFLLDHPGMDACTGLRRVLCGGEALPATLLTRFRERLPHAALHNLYGPSEAATALTALDCAPESERATVPIGRPIANTRVYVLDGRGAPVPVGVSGELFIGGAGVARGYLDRPALTAERFVPDPFAAEAGARLYRTGDLVRWLADGRVEFLGRTDFQVKVRGHRIELGEVEAAVSAHPQVREAVVEAREDGAGGRRLIAYYVAAAPLEAEALREGTAAHLPDYMVPAAFVRLEAMPLTPNGKLDRKALPAPDADSFATREYEAPVGATEQVVAEIWAEILGVERVGRADHFFELGGHSLLAVTLIERMRRRELKADIRALFTTPTLAEFAAAVDGRGPAEVVIPENLIPAGCEAITPEMLPLVAFDQAEVDRVVATVAGGAANLQDVYPLAPLQEGILFHHLLAADGDPYLLSVLFAGDSRERVDAFLAAMQAVIDRHDILRTGIVWEGLPEPVQVVWRTARMIVEEAEVDPTHGDGGDQLLRRFDPRHYRIDIAHAPLMRAVVARDMANGRWMLLLLRHHLVSDHTTVETLLGEVQAILAGEADTLPAPLPFRTFVAQTRLGVSRGEHEGFFTELLGDVDEPTAPFGLLDARGDGTGVGEAKCELDPALALRLRERSRKLGVSAAALCHVAYAQVLARVSGREDVVFGTLLLGRMQGGEGADRVLGQFINTLPVRLRVGSADVEAGVRRMQRLLADLMRHENASLALAQRCSRVVAPTPLFSALLNYRHSSAVEEPRTEAARQAWAGLERVSFEERTNYPMALSVDDLGDGFRLTAQVDASVGADRVCAMMHTALERLVDALETAPATPLARMEVLPADERRLVVEEWNATDAPFASDSTFHELFQAQVDATPAAVALVQDADVFTYAELNARANRLAHHLRGLGVRPDARVAICVERSPEMVIAVLAVMKAGGAYVPLDPAYPTDRLRYMLDDSAPAALLTQSSLAGLLGDVDLPVLALDADAARWADEPDANPSRDAVGLRPEHLAYVIYTSGSTGRPKGVMVRHRGACNLVAAQQQAFPVDGASRILQFASFSFDACVFEMAMALTRGAALHLPPRGGVLAGEALVETMAEQGITHVTLPPAVLAALPDDADMPSVRMMVLAGDVVTEAVARRWGVGRQLFNAYGPTETTVWATLHECDAAAAGNPPIGRPIANTRVYVLDARGEPVPVGVAGELCVGGAGVARGYLDRPDLTADRFVADPFSGEADARLYRTGDRARWLADGTIEFMGRNDFQVKLRGFRIELGEIESRLAEHPQVREAAVLAREDMPGDKRLVAYYVAAESTDIEVEALRAHVAERLPEHLVPAAFVHLSSMPLNPNGKVDRKALPAPEAGAFATRGYEEPIGAMETALAAVWKDVLRVERVGRHDHFFELGGHSLLAVQVISRVRQAVGVSVALGDLFARPVLADFAAGLETAAGDELPAITPAIGAEREALSFAQRRMWFLERLGGGGSAYHIPAALRFRGEMDGAALAAALERIVARHESLRTTFHEVDGEPVQRIASPEESRFRLVPADLRGHADAEAELRRVMEAESAAPFDLATGPLIRGRLVRMGEGDHVLLVTMHHIVSDGWSVGVLTGELNALYAACLRGEPDPHGPLAVQYADYAAWQRRWVSGEVLRRQGGYWQAALAGAPEVLELPTDRPRPAQRDAAGAAVALELDEELTAALKSLARRHGATTFMALMAGWATVLGRLAGTDDLVIGTPTANRGRREIEGLVGFFVNSVALRVDLSGEPTVAELLARVKARALAAQHNQDIPFEQVVELVQPARSLAHTPLFQVMLTWQNAPREALSLPGLTLVPLEHAERSAAKVDLSLTLEEADGRITGTATYASALFDAPTIERHLGYLRRVLAAMAADDGQPVRALPMLSAAERAQVVEGWNRTDAEFPRETCVHELFEAQVERTPHATAVSSDEGSLSYAELNARANRLAHHLRERGVGPDGLVAICLERSPEMVVALLATLKAGGAYLPLDPGCPVDRLRYMLADAAPAVVLTQASLAAPFAGCGVPCIDLASSAEWDHQPAANPAREGLTPAHLAYVIYTSGSTGRPKGVMVRHAGLTHYACWARSRYAPGAPLAFALYSSFAFDLTVTSIYVPLISGGSIVVYGEDPGGEAAILRVFAEDRVDVVKLTPAHLALLEQRGTAVRRIARLVVGGEDLKAPLARSVVEGSAGRLEIHNEYGPTEATVGCMIHEFRTERDRGASVPIGVPIANTRVYVLDARGEPAPIGVAGELFVGGVQVARGYLGRPELTAERFVADPFSADADARMYRTGDLARWRADGTMEFLGRNDFQVKVRGFRIEPGEIEARLAEHPTVHGAAVLAREDVPGDPRLVAYYAALEAVSVEELRAHLAAALPEHMVPAAFMHLPALPLSHNGKVDRAALPAPDGAAFATRGYEAPVGETETAVAAIWSDVLGIERIGRADHFFELGGHSLLAVKVVSRVRRALGVEAELGDLFTRPVLAEFARGVETAARAALPPIVPAPPEDRAALSFAQQRLWFLEQMGTAGAYHVPAALRLRGELDRAALRGALDGIVARHEALRTTFHAADGEPVQRVAPAAESRFHLVELDLAGRPHAEAELERLTAEEAGAPFDLARGPLVRGRLVRMAADEHVLMVTMHHVVSDGWSVGVLVQELSALYAALREGRADPLPELPVQYADYAAWQRRWVSGEVLGRQAEHWKRTLSGAPPVLELPADRPRPAQQDYAGALVDVALDGELTAALKSLGQRHGTTLFMTLMAGWAAVLARLSGQDDVVVGTPTANRGRPEIEGLIGFFVNTLALRVDLSGSPTVAEVLGGVKAQALAAQHSQDIPFEQVVELVQPARSLAHSPLFQVMFAWQNALPGRLELPGLSVSPAITAPRVNAQFDLTLSLRETDGRITGSLEYATALFDRATVERYAGYLHATLREMAADEHRAVRALPMLPPAERRTLLEEWNATAADFPAATCIHRMFEAQVARTPGADAVAFRGVTLTYAELNARANRLAHHLRSLGVRPDTRVAICAERGLEMMVGLLAILKAGGAYVPLDPAYPADRLRWMLEDSAPAVLLMDGRPSAALAGIDIPTVDLRSSRAWAECPAADPEPAGQTSDHLAYVIYTSGSTGRPKGVMNTHRGVANLLSWMQREWGLTGGDAVLQMTSFGFDASVCELFWALTAGARVVLARPDAHRDLDHLVDVIRGEGITTINLVPSLLQAWIEHPAAGTCTTLARVLCGGEALAPALARRFGERLPHAALHNLYGPTETADTVATWRCGAGADGSIPIGRPAANNRLYVLDALAQPVPVGVAGELYVGGTQVARGYLGRPELTAERFVADPFSADRQARMYRTGDLARWLPDGNLEYLGRNDFQVKVRGFRIELGEIEARLAQHDDVREAVVMAREDGPGEKRLVAYYVSDEAIGTDEMRAHVQGRLPEHMVPAAFVWLDALPLNPNGKLDRRALPAPEGGALSERAYEAPLGETETVVAAVWADVLKVERVGRWDHFFELGGHSLLAVQMVSRVRRALGAEVALGDLFARPVLRDFASGLVTGAGAALPPIVPAPAEERAGLSFAQRRLWFLEQMGAGGRAYHIPAALRLRGGLDRDALGRALDRIVQRHESLRTTFRAADGEPAQRIAPEAEACFHLAAHDLVAHPDGEAELRRVMADEAAAPFDLESGPLVRGRLVRLAADDHVLLVTMHHVVSDGWSMGVLVRELNALYAAFTRGEGDPLPALPIQYADYAAWQRRWVDGEVLRRQGDYWTRTLAGAPELLELPADRARPAQRDHAGALARLELDEEATAALKALARRNGATLYATLLAGWAMLLARLSNQHEVVVGSPTANRDRAEIEGLVGFFVNTLAVRVDLSGSPTVAEVLARVKARALAAQQHQDIPFEQVVERVQPVRSMAHTPLFQALFAWQNTPGGGLALPGLEVEPVETAAHATARFDLTLNLEEADGRIAGGVEYATSLFDAPTVERWLGYLRRLLMEMAADEHPAAGALPMLSDAERRRVVEEWNATNADFPRGESVHALFAVHAERTPHALAVAEGERSLTYAELDACANRLAHAIRSRGVEPGDHVAVVLERSAQLVVAELATLKSGAVYVPIDPSFPAERIAFMLADSGSRVALTTAAVRLPAALVDRIDVETLSGAVHGDLSVPTDGGAPAYVMYTSGSTGMPKGVVVPHRAITRLVINSGYADFGPADRVAFAANPAFDASTMEVWAPLLNGGSIAVVAQHELLDPARFGQALTDRGITVLFITTAVFNQYAATIPGALAKLRCLLNGGERADPASFARVLAEGGPVSVIHCYGPTETTTYAITLPVTSVAEGAQSIPLGRPIGNTTIYVLDSHGQPVPTGVAGEIHIGGAGVALGYLNRPELTAEKFVADPFSAEKDARMYRTGDLARWLADGTLEFMGRTDFQVKVRGFRIELGEIEARLLEHADLRETIVLAREDVVGDKRLVAYYVSDDAVEVDVLRAHLAETLPDYMVPAAFVHLAAMPLNANGKVDRRALPAPEGDAFATRGYEAPATEAEATVARIWSELLRVERVGRNDHFFSLGGHSLLAVQVISRVRDAVSVEVALGDLFTRPVLADFARGLESAARADLPAITPAHREGPLPLSFAQQRLWFLEQLGSGGRAYHVPTALRLTGTLHRAALRRALDRIVARHESLRTTFHEADGQPEQRITPLAESRFALAEHDVAGHPDADAELRRLVDAEAGAAFELARGPLIRGTLVRLAADEHALLVTMHHVVSDGWSMGVLVGELNALYGAFSRGGDDPLPPLAVQYADYAAWQRRRVDGEVLRRQGGYWREALAGIPEVLELPADRPRPAQPDHAGAAVPLELDGELSAALRALAARHGATLFMTLMAGWAAVLGRLSGQDDVVVGTPTANRGRSEVEGLIGFFVNTLALRADLSGSPTVAELLARVKGRALAAQHHQDIPFEQVVDAVQPARSLAHSPVFQVLFAWQNTPRETLSLPGLTLAPLAGAAQETAKFDLSLALQETGGRIAGGLTYATALFDRATAERWTGYLRNVLAAMAADDAQVVDRLPMLGGDERRQVVEEWNATDAEYPAGACIHHLVEAQAARTPDAVAVSSEAGSLTYAELNARANRLAQWLRARGVGPDVRVGICVERGAEMVAGVLAVLKAGGAYVPLDPAYPADRLRFMLEDSAPAVLLTQGPLAGMFAGIDVPVVDVAGDAGAWDAEPESDPRPAGLAPDHLAYVIYTSGSTGRPKGVMNQHRTLVNRLSWGQKAWRLGADEAVLGQTSLSFDGHVRELLWPLTAGARVVLARPDGHREPAYLAELVRREAITTLNLVPSLLQALLEHPGFAACGGVRRILCGGEALPSALVRQVRDVLPGAELHNLYGPSEAATALTAPECDGGEARAVVPIGRPIANTRVYVLDGGGQPVPVGVAGELCIAGTGVARGYLGRPGMTAERFVPDPFSSEPGGRMYRTGDRTRRLADGRVEFLGRTDFQLKVRGFRVEPGEIEARLLDVPQVREAVAAVHGEGGGQRLVAYFTASQAVEAEALRAHLAERLPEHMVPAAYVRLDALPLTPSGKLDRRALPAPDADAFAARDYEAPATTAEDTVAGIWAEVLRLERVGRHDQFFELGGHSLLAVQVVSRVRQALGVEAAVRDLFLHPVLADFARCLDSARASALPPIEPAERGERIPLSFAQQRLWFLHQLGGSGAAYHIPKVLRLHGPLDAEALAGALDRIVQRHESLRTTFPTVDGHPVQRIAPAEASRFPLARQHVAAHDADALRTVIARETAAPFDLEAGPLVRGRLVRLADDDHVLVITLHHVVSDGWSMGVLVGELSALYAASLRGEGDPLPPLPVQYADYAAWQRRWLSGDALHEQAAYWRGALAGAPEVLELPTDRPRPAQPDARGAFARLELDAELTAGLHALGRRHGATLFMTLLAGWATTLARLSGQRDVVVGTPTANRGRRETEALVGFFLNTLALRIDLAGNPSVAQALARTRAAVMGAQHHEDLPFEQVVELVHPGRNLGHAPLFQVLFAWQNTPRETLDLPGLTLGLLDAAPSYAAKFDLTLTLGETDGRIDGGVVYPTALFDAATIDRHLAYLRTVLQGMVGDERESIDRLPMLPPAEREQVVTLWNATAKPVATDVCIHQQFEAQVERTPHAPAVSFDGDSLTYAELNARANRLAHHLRALGVRPDARVAVCLERGLEMMVGLLAVLKAGGAYVPLDPEYPADRLRYMLDDSAPVAVLTHGAFVRASQGVGVPVLDLSAAEPEWAHRPATNPDPAEVGLTADHLAYVIYTSGSTGKPKGVMNGHRGVANLLAWAQETWNLQPGEAVMQRMSFSFDVSVRELFWPLTVGARVVMLRPEGHKDPRYLVETIRRENVGTVHLVPSLLQVILDDPDVEGCTSLARVMCGGEAVQPALAQQFYRRLPDAVLYQMYGPTETTVAVTARRCSPDEASVRIPLGRPVANTRIYLLDPAGEPVPVGVAGEMHVAGLQVARGYLDRPALTAERFVPDAFSGEAGARMYRTGDLARWLADGAIEFLGRDDDQVKVRGFRIELGEIEARLAEHPDVREAAVLAREDAPGEKRLVAYVASESAEAEGLRAYLAERLPEYMVPAAYVRLDALPLTANGKVDRRALPAPEGDAFVTRAYEAPLGETETALAAIWAELLKLDRVGRHDHFFDLGGHSLLATDLVLRIKQEMEVEVALRDVFTTPVLSALADLVLDAQLAQFDAEEVALLSELEPSPFD
jgi:amino acid adenylation domain-containing protein